MASTGLENQETKTGTELFVGLDSFLTTSGEIEIDDSTGIIVENETSRTLATKKAEEDKEKSIENSDLIEVDAKIPTNTKTVNTSSNKEIKDTQDETINTTIEDTTNTTEDIEKTEAEALKSFVSLLKEKDVLTNIDIDSYDGSIEGLKESIYNEAKTMAEDYKATLPPVIKYLVDNYEEGVPLEELINIKSNEIRYSSIDTEKLKEDTNLQKEVYKEFLKKTTNFSDTKVNKEITRLEETGELATEVDEALPELIKFEKQREKQIVAETKAAQERTKKQNEETLSSIKKTADQLKGKEIVPGIKLTDKDVQGIYKSLTTPVGYDDNGSPISEIQKMRSEDPIGFEIRLNHIAKMTKGFTDFSEILKKAKTVVAKEVEKAATSTSTYKGGKSNIVEEDKPKDLLSAFSRFQKARQK